MYAINFVCRRKISAESRKTISEKAVMKRKASDPDYVPMASLQISSFSGMKKKKNKYTALNAGIRLFSLLNAVCACSSRV